LPTSISPARFCWLLAAALLTGCYLPSDFVADLRITPDGDYNFQYTGQLTYLPLLEKLDKGGLSQAETTERIKAVTEDLARDKGFEEISYVDRAMFRVRYKRVGNILREKSYTFIRLNSRLISMERRANGMVDIFGDKPNTADAQRIAATGLVMRGQLRIQTEAQVVQQNATEMLDADPAVYIWRIDGVEQPSPRLILSTRR
jgi:hypothetical protein